ncbi:hypothetical protein CU633_03705 [Bacillus sp. V3-13]|uniref:DMT family transporter n=1 Tax=Bacillus sp. V3-13 TaxID=2053728 RepID=UPI000C780D78|nr:multidrug resistance efflux transporter family protein [Bacillus sp. V3-13]PLR78671.1 hypothetical protein CU633_03705 [Bacillus sp. V3-13]
MRPILLGVFAAFFFSVTFVLNRSMELAGGSWIWSAALRFIFMVPLLLLIVLARRNLLPLLKVMKEQPRTWLLWSFVGFGLFYAPICFAAAYSPGWLIAGTWQITIISGSLLAPLFIETIQTENGPIKIRGKVPYRGLIMSVVILVGIALMQFEHTSHISLGALLLGIIPVMIASFAYPLGNRKMMEISKGRLDAYQRALGMTLASLPFWFLLSFYGVFTVGLPGSDQVLQAVLVAICSGVIATALFFKATDLVRGDMQKLATVEATQSMEVLFALALELIFLSINFPSLLSWTGICLVILGMILHSYVSHKSTGNRKQAVSI